MKVSTFFKGCLLAAVVLLLSTEAFAQLPVRTQTLQLIGPGGNLTMTTATSAAYSVIWPANVTTVTDGEDAVIVATRTGTTMQFNWQEVNNALIDGLGVLNQIAYFSDPNTIVSSANFVVDPLTGSVSIGDAAIAGSIVLNSSGVGNSNVTLNTNSTTASTFNFPTYGPVGTYNVVATTDVGTVGQIPVVAADGSVAWEDNPLTGAQRGVFDPVDGNYTAAVAVTGTPDANDLILVSCVDAGGVGNILSVTTLAAGTINVASAGPFGAGERISWLWIAIP